MRSDLRLSDLGQTRPASKLMNVKVPDTVAEAINEISEELGCTKTEAVVALLNEGLDAYREQQGPVAKPATDSATE